MAVLLRAALNAAPQLQRPLLWKIQRLLLPVLHGGRPRRQDVVGRLPRITCEQQQASARQHESHGFKRPWQLALAKFVATILSTNDSIFGGVMSKINRDK